MNWRTTLILAVVVLAGFAYLRFFEMKQPSTEEARRQAQNVVNFDRNKIDGIVIQNGDEKIEIRRHDNKWRLATPFKDQADGALVENLLSDLETWQKEGAIPRQKINGSDDCASAPHRGKDACWRDGVGEEGRSLGHRETTPRAGG